MKYSRFVWKCDCCGKVFDYFQVEFNNKIYCSDKCCAKEHYTEEQYKMIYGG